LRIPIGVLYYFFFSSRRRHTSFSRDWSSDVCSSDLLFTTKERFLLLQEDTLFGGKKLFGLPDQVKAAGDADQILAGDRAAGNAQIGRASCRERVWISGVAVSFTKRSAADT